MYCNAARDIDSVAKVLTGIAGVESVLTRSEAATRFHLMASRTLAQWDPDRRPPIGARVAGGLSLALWAAIVVCGRMIAYHWFDPDPASLAG